MFYLKYRPQTIEDIDTAEIRNKLKILLQGESIPHALLFTGPKGTGKTSAARIIAKSINCLKNLYAKKSDSFEPCNRCDNCTAITAGNSIDIVEIDAASNRKIDDIRSLIEQVKYAPLHNRYKVYIIDEVHMLTTESFNALLKTLEEPPSATIFILATTEVEKLPKTIVSRCINFNFARASQNEIIRMLKRIGQSENIKITDESLQLIAKYSDNSFRDGAKLFEEVCLQNKTEPAQIKELLGLKEDNDQILKSLSELNLKKTFALIDEYNQSGLSFKTLIEFMLDQMHDQLLLRAGIKNIEETKSYNLTLAQITKLIKLLQEAYTTLRISPIESLPLEIAVAEYFEAFKDK